MNVIFTTTDEWKRAFPGAHAGVLAVSQVTNPASNRELEQHKAELVQELRTHYGGMSRAQLEKLPVLQAYKDYYKRFDKTYHVQLQLESILFKGKSIPNVAGLVEAAFMAEMKDWLLTASHDLDTLQMPLTLDVTRGSETYTLLRGEARQVKAGDMMISDEKGIISNILYGPDQRTQIRPSTRSAVYTTYAPAGINPLAVSDHLRDIEHYIHLFSPESQTELLQVFG
jgi:DNA/RNA-binding domain of Phe-tRNA-synthetase-like protein